MDDAVGISGNFNRIAPSYAMEALMLNRRLIAWWAGLLAALGGCTLFLGGFGNLGIMLPPQHPTTRLQSASLTPQGAVASGQQLVVSARISPPGSGGSVSLQLYADASVLQAANLLRKQISTEWIYVPLRDDGRGGDRLARDGLWSGSCNLRTSRDCSAHALVLLSFPKRFGQPRYLPQTVDLGEVSILAGPAPGQSGSDTSGVQP